jgi:hypothetical protein
MTQQNVGTGSSQSRKSKRAHREVVGNFRYLRKIKIKNSKIYYLLYFGERLNKICVYKTRKL